MCFCMYCLTGQYTKCELYRYQPKKEEEKKDASYQS